jgi:ubiquinone/menaquinone biosynthesis C-methylase UbiE
MSTEFKRKLSGSVALDSGKELPKSPRPPPAYGSHRYWEDRYRAQFHHAFGTTGSGTGDEARGADEANASAPKPFAWYFTYAELRPLILPLILEQVDENDDASSRGGLAVTGPIGVLEIGCGDSPLGIGIAEEVRTLEGKLEHSDIIQRIVCCDYSSTVIDVLRKSKDQPKGGESLVPLDVGDVALSFEVIDARKLPYDSGSFDLILEKGVLDAMLSDAESGKENCLKILSECSRVLVYDGFMVIVSHQNAETPTGKRWLEDVLFRGLQKVPGSNWIVEIHVGGYDDAKPPGMVGPAVYVIQKTKANGDDEGCFDVRSYTY